MSALLQGSKEFALPLHSDSALDDHDRDDPAVVTSLRIQLAPRRCSTKRKCQTPLTHELKVRIPSHRPSKSVSLPPSHLARFAELIEIFDRYTRPAVRRSRHAHSLRNEQKPRSFMIVSSKLCDETCIILKEGCRDTTEYTVSIV